MKYRSSNPDLFNIDINPLRNSVLPKGSKVYASENIVVAISPKGRVCSNRMACTYNHTTRKTEDIPDCYLVPLFKLGLITDKQVDALLAVKREEDLTSRMEDAMREVAYLTEVEEMRKPEFKTMWIQIQDMANGMVH